MPYLLPRIFLAHWDDGVQDDIQDFQEHTDEEEPRRKGISGEEQQEHDAFDHPGYQAETPRIMNIEYIFLLFPP
jgi:hypothetical protein